MSQPTITRAADQPVAGGIRFALQAEHTAGLLDLGTEAVTSGGGPPMHVHHDVDEIVLVLSGLLAVRVDGQDDELGPGDAAFLPRGIEHGFTNAHDEPCRVVWLITPGGFHAFMAELDALGSWDPEQVTPVFTRHRCAMTGPPLAELLGTR